MVNYQLGKIYKIVGDGNIYIGSTCEKLLSHRLGGHVGDYKRFLNEKSQRYITSFECLKNNNYYIELLETCPCNTKDELHVRERFWIDTIDCVNKYVPIRTNEENLERYKLYYKKNKDKLLERDKKYREKNKDKILEYREKNKDKFLEYKKLYREKNKDKISERMKLYYQSKKNNELNS